MRKMICMILALLLTFGLLAGCGAKTSESASKEGPNAMNDALRQEIRDYYHYSGEDTESTIAGKRYYGTYNGYVVLMDAGVIATVEEVVIGGRIFRWGSSKLRIQAYKDGQVLPLQDVYAAGEITDDDLDQILGAHKAYFATCHNWEYGDSVLSE